MRLIDADALQRKICGANCGCEYEDCGNEGDCSLDLFIFHAPSVDAVPVVRCKDCKHITPVEGGLPLCALHNIACAYNDFCSYGERKEGDS